MNEEGMTKYGTPDVCPVCGAPLSHGHVKHANGEKVETSTCKKGHYSTSVPEENNANSRKESGSA